MTSRILTSAAVICVLLCTGANIPSAAAQTSTVTASEGWDATLTTGVKYTSWRRTKGDVGGAQTGAQTTAPVQLDVTGKTIPAWLLSFKAKTALYDSHRSFAGGALKGDKNGITDMLLSGRAAYLGYGGIVPFYELGLNLPTGDSLLRGNQKFTRMDPDLVDLPSYGEGFNVAQTAGVMFPVSYFSRITTGLGYTWRGAYDKEDFANVSHDVDPGNVYRAFVNYDYKNAAFNYGLNFTYARETAMQVDDADTFKSGDAFVVGGNAGYEWTPQARSSVSAQYATTRTDEVQTGAGLADEPFNTNGPSLSLGAAHTQKVSDRLDVTGRVGYMRRFENEWSSAVADYLPARTKVSAGVDVTYQLTPDLSFSLSPQAFRLKDDDHPFFPDPAYTYVGYSVGAGMKAKF